MQAKSQRVMPIALLCLGVAVSTASANLLEAPSFEVAQGAPDASAGDMGTATAAPGNPWIGWNPWVSPFAAFYTAVTAHTGTQAGKTFGQPSGIYQFVDVSGVNGQPFSGSAWFINLSADPLMGGADQTVDYRVTFFDGPNGTGNQLALIISSSNISGATTQDVWTELTINGMVPAGAVSAQVMGFMWNPNSAGGALFMDDASFQIVPEPAGLALLGLGAVALLRRR